MIINFITDKNDKKLLQDVDKIFDGFSIKYNSGTYQKNIVHYLEYKCSPANINIFVGYINNLLIDYSQNNVFIFDKLHFCQSWVNQLHNYNLIIVTHTDDKIIDFSLKRDILFMDLYASNINDFYKSVIRISNKLNSIKLPIITNQMELDNLPYISVCLPTYNRRKFKKLVELNYKNTTYPKDKIEFIVLDDGTDKMNDLLIDNVKYYHNKEKKTIGWKRNECVRLATHDIIAFIDDDDYYYPDSLLNRVGNLLKSNKECVFCSTLGCFHIYKYSSIINVSPIEYPLEKKVSEATLTFKKSFWHNNKFNNEDKLNEGEYFVKNALDKCKEINWENVIVQLLHTYNTVTKNVKIEEQNGSHFGFSDIDFTTITSI